MQNEILVALTSLPGVTAAGFSNFLPASNATIRYQVQLQSVAREQSADDHDLLTVGERSVTSNYFQALGARVSAGTSCPVLAQVREGPPKALVNRRFAETYANGQNIVGRYLGWAQGQGGNGPPMQIVGVVDDIREDNLRTPAVPYLYSCIGPGEWPDPEYVVRTGGDPRTLLPAIRSALHGVAPSRAIFGAMTLDDDVVATLGQTRLQTELVATFGFAAVALAVMGLYGLVALAVTTHRREIGIRIALGAAPQRVVRDLAGRVARLVVGGAATGLAMTVIAQRELRAVVFGVAPLDPTTLIAAVVGLGVAASIATLVPAWRAARIDPVEAMRDG